MNGRMTWADYIINNLRQSFEHITEFNSRPTSPDSSDYNCIAWAYGRNDIWCHPDSEGQYFWPISNRKYSVDAFMELFSSIGYILCTDESKEDGFLKIVLYVDKEGLPTHAARQLITGKWTSKLGSGIDIEHDSPDNLNGSIYGIAKIFMKRKADSEPI
jgi:hypothetical protein